MQQKCTVEPGALLKILAHASKFPASAINGVLLGTSSGGEGGEVFVQDVIPLCHTSLALAPALETGLAMVRTTRSNRSSGMQYVWSAGIHSDLCAETG
jgi:hypothetical protein